MSQDKFKEEALKEVKYTLYNIEDTMNAHKKYSDTIDKKLTKNIDKVTQAVLRVKTKCAIQDIYKEINDLKEEGVKFNYQLFYSPKEKIIYSVKKGIKIDKEGKEHSFIYVNPARGVKLEDTTPVKGSKSGKWLLRLDKLDGDPYLN